MFVKYRNLHVCKSPWVIIKAKTGPKKKKSGEFGDEKRKILADSDMNLNQDHLILTASNSQRK